MNTKYMNLLKSWLLVVILLSSYSELATAQSVKGFNQNRMNRDLSIMQDVLGKLFSNNYDNSFTSFTQQVNGTYLPGYGILFRVPGSSAFSFRLIEKDQDIAPPPPTSLNRNLDSAKKKVEKKYVIISNGSHGSNETSKNSGLSKEDVINNAVRFFEDYAEAIGQIKPDEHIVIIYQSHDFGFAVEPFLRSSGKASVSGEAATGPLNLSISAKKADITAFRMGKISNKAFRSRLKIIDLNNSGNDIKDVKIMSGILQAALKQDEKGSFTIRGDVKYLIQPGYGALFFARTGYNNGNAPLIFLSKKENAHAYSFSFSSTDSSNSKDAKLSSKEHIRKAFDDFVDNIKQSLIDYGRTMRSLKPGQHITLSLDISRDYNILPKRIDFRVSQKTLSDYDLRKITMDQAISRIIETKY